MKIAIICGSHRKDSESLKVSSYLSNLIQSEKKETYILNLGTAGIPLWEESVWSDDAGWKKLWSPYSEELKSSDGIVIVSPEYGGMAAPALKNFFLLCSKQELAHKPGLIVTVSAARGGAYPVSELRASSYKNTQICYMPEHIIVRNAKQVLNPNPENPLDEDTYLRKRIPYALSLLYSYADALALVRNSGIPDYKAFANGMS
ncbi:MAG: NAD(P)H-dependent oxidoreductase [Leptospiraceae bacterium]|nr:NAD(P)H-dependent oxidoreductase [Leptospiraceae bacterium]